MQLETLNDRLKMGQLRLGGRATNGSLRPLPVLLLALLRRVLETLS